MQENLQNSQQTYQELLAERGGWGFPEAEVIDLLGQILPQLSIVHERGSVHGKISLESLVYDQGTNLSFLASEVPLDAPHFSDTLNNQINGQKGKKLQRDVTEDIYAVGVTAILLLTGQNIEVLKCWRDYCSISDSFANFLQKAIADKVEVRYANARQMLIALQGISQSTIVAAPNDATKLSSTTSSNIPTTPSMESISEWEWLNYFKTPQAIVLISLTVLLLGVLWTTAEKNNLGSDRPRSLQTSTNPDRSASPNNLPPSPSIGSLPPSSSPSVTPRNTPPTVQNPFDGATFPQPACGDSLPDDPKSYPVNLYPVFIDYSDANLQAIKTRFCADAIQKFREKKNIESVQVASFVSLEKAKYFQDFLTKNRFSGADVGEPTNILTKPGSTVSSDKTINSATSSQINEQESQKLIISFYLLISQKEFSRAADLYAPNLVKQFDTNFFRQFQKVTIDEISVVTKSNNTITLLGINTYIWNDGSSQQEKRSYTVGLIDGKLKILRSDFIEVIRFR